MKLRAKARVLAVLIAIVVLAGCGSPAAPATTAPATTAPAPATTAPATTAPATPAPPSDEEVLFEAAYGYFENFPSDKNVIPAKDLLALIDSGEDMFILDIRRPEDYAKGHLKGAVNISFFTTDIADKIESIPNDKPVMVYCYTGQTASQVTALLNIAGKMAKNAQSGFNNGIAKAENYENYLEETENALPTDTYPVDDVFKKALKDYFTNMRTLDGTAMANFNLKPEDVKTIVDNEDDTYYILSVRQAEDYAKGHIKGAANIPYGQGMEVELSKLPKDKVIIVYCYSGQTSSQTMAVLRMMGYDAYSMSGGMGNAEAKTGWLGAGYEVVAS